MNVTVYLECEGNNFSDKNYDDYYKDENSYVKALEDSYNQTKDLINERMNNGFTSLLKDNYSSFNTFSMFTNKSSKNEEKHVYTACNSNIMTENFEDLKLDDLLQYSFNKDVYINIFDFNFNTAEEEFETEFKMWVKEHEKINSVKSSDEWKTINEPKRDIRIKFINNLNTESFALLKNCKIIDYIDEKGYAILVERISFINNI